ncbi:hypothetical protein JXA80_10550 [bacterium]|nr:hypothetical protein [candidate division CSSED10-310 bacterium]
MTEKLIRNQQVSGSGFLVIDSESRSLVIKKLLPTRVVSLQGIDQSLRQIIFCHVVEPLVGGNNPHRTLAHD